MLRKEVKFTGFIAYYGPKKSVKEKENFINKDGVAKATNWYEIDKDKLTALELVWKDEPKITIDKKDYPHIQPNDWFFTQTAYFDMQKQETVVISRNIGFKKDGYIQVYTVEENTGILKSSMRKG